jgi:8-oxo-dGTP pyrophosphatase MutT (NUDIX family)
MKIEKNTPHELPHISQKRQNTSSESKHHQTVIDCIVANTKDKTILIQQRSGSRKLFPYCWEFLGGHQEPGETIETCIKRELFEEGNLQLTQIITKLHEFYWSYEQTLVKDIVYLIEAAGNFKLEEGKAISHKWIKRDEAHLILKPGERTNGLYEAAHKAFDILEQK